ncbi:MAG TPA: alpha/beta fold hydrolase [Candidatus Paceibacterota bacterium]|nr:alpha/beta fold hydrolase [Candidatus Paceibacterota bacterium]
MYSNITITTEDKKILSGIFFEAPNPRGWVLCLHMMPSTKESYIKLAEKLQEKNFEVLAIDFRGHGSSEGGPDRYLGFSNTQHQEKYNDVVAGADFLSQRGNVENNLFVIGASIGANLGFKLISENNNCQKAVLLSPGIDYHGILTKNSATQISKDKKIMFVASEDDGYAVDESKELIGLLPEGVEKNKIFFKDAGHGTGMLESHPELADEIIKFINS